jgi:hypothetical protein
MRLGVTGTVMCMIGVLIAVHMAEAQVPERTTLESFTAFLRKVAAEPKGARAVADRPLGPGFVTEVDGVDLGFSENSNAGRSIDDVMAAAIKEYGSFCDDLKSQPVAGQDGPLALRRSSYTCRVFEEGYGEMIVMSDGKRFQLFDFGGHLREKSKIAGLGKKIYDGLLAAYR